MAATMKTDGMEELSKKLEQYQEKAGGIAAKALYKGAGVMAKALNDSINTIQTAPFKWASKRKGETRKPSPEEKNILLDAGIGIAKFDKDGSFVQTSVGFDTAGYANVNWRRMLSTVRTNYKASGGQSIRSSRVSKKLKASQNQKPIGVIANAINSGTSFMPKQAFFRKGVSNGTPGAMAAMMASIDQSIEEINGGK